MTYILALYFLKCHTFFQLRFSIFSGSFWFWIQMCLKLIFTYRAQVSEHSIAILTVHIKHRDRYLILGEICWDTLYECIPKIYPKGKRNKMNTNLLKFTSIILKIGKFFTNA